MIDGILDLPVSQRHIVIRLTPSSLPNAFWLRLCFSLNEMRSLGIERILVDKAF